MKKINKHIVRDLKLVVEWIRANRLSLNTSETELVIFKSKNKIISKHLNFCISGQKLNLHPNSNTAINHLLDILQKQTCHYGSCSMVFTASKVWHDIINLFILYYFTNTQNLLSFLYTVSLYLLLYIF